MSEPEVRKDPQEIETTPEVTEATPAELEPVVETEPVVDHKALYEEELERAKRHREQLAGKDKLIKQLQEQKIAESFQPTRRVEPETDEYDYEDTPKKVVQQIDPNQQLRDQILVRSAVLNNITEIKDKYRDDKYLPFTKDVQAKVEAELDSYDPTGRYKLYPEYWDKAYQIVRSQELEKILQKESDKVAEEKNIEIEVLKSKEVAKIEDQVVTSTKPQSELDVPSIEDVLSGKVEMTSAEMKEFFGKEMAAEYDKLLDTI